ncbi:MULTISPECIES: RadC family protein [Oceanobacillus]|uniref:RadC family protein n=1 Tax=Oceanobacillus TaxID=182709 RepID=UPI000595BCEE|nr:MULTISPECIES: DNA repair protein RadC [Oceanobacillus]
MSINMARENMLKYVATGNDLLTSVTDILSVIAGGHANKEAIQQLSQLSIKGLSTLSIEEMIVYGLSKNQALSIHASFLMIQRYIQEQKEKGYIIRSPEDAANYIMEEMRKLEQEHFKALFLNTKNEVIKSNTIFIGSLNASVVHPRETFKVAIKCSAASVILAHNHPSGNPSPSQEDILVTKRFVEGGKIMGIEVLDHIVIGDNKFVSIKQKGYI